MTVIVLARVKMDVECDQCNITVSVNEYPRHMRVVHNIDRAKCPCCQRYFKMTSYFAKHIESCCIIPKIQEADIRNIEEPTILNEEYNEDIDLAESDKSTNISYITKLDEIKCKNLILILNKLTKVNLEITELELENCLFTTKS